MLASVRPGTVRLVWDEATRRETEYVVNMPAAGQRGSLEPVPSGRTARRADLPHQLAFIPDPADREFAALAAATGAVLLTRDNHLLNGRPHTGVVVLTPGEFVRQVWTDAGGS